MRDRVRLVPLARVVTGALAAMALAACGGRALDPPEPAATVGVRPRAVVVGVAEPLLADGESHAAIAPGRFLVIFEEPAGSSAVSFDTRNPFGERVRMLVTGARRDAAGEAWLRVSLPVGTGDEEGWVRAADVRTIEEPFRIEVDLSKRRLVLERRGRAIHRFRVAVGAPGFPTPTGIFYVWAHAPQQSPSGPYGVFALGLSTFSPDIHRERIAIHGTADPFDPGRAVSHGCIRVYNPEMLKLRRVPLGTPVIVRR